MNAADLRQQYSTFHYKSFDYRLTPQGLAVAFTFETSPNLVFHPSLLVSGVTQAHLETLPAGRLDTYVFSLGLVEMLSYWKATCSPEIVIEAGPLSPEQLAWWRKLLIKGMGEYFYVNQIDFTSPDFVTLQSTTTAPSHPLNEDAVIPETIESLLIPVGGGKDSAVTLELLSQSGPGLPTKLATVAINPTPAASQLSQLSSISPQFLVERHLDPLILELNEQGYLNGHTPFSALAAFTTVLVAELFGYAGVAVSNERSSNEGNARFKDVEVNHQYSKTFEFEQDFQRYCQTYLPGSPYYFSFMRPLYELQIGKLFATLTAPEAKQRIRYTFRSCNRGQKTNSWCGECSKCLFAYSILAPFIEEAELKAMFGNNLLADDNLWHVALELVGKGENKPFECVGTYEESLIAFYLTAQKYRSNTTTGTLPALVAKIETDILNHEPNLDSRAQQLLVSWNQAHGVPNQLANHLKNATL